jgi:long-chain acyl-CoA synthetase
MISNANFMFQVAHAPTIFELEKGDPALSFLPLCHIAERNAGAYFPLAFGHVVHFAENAGTVFADLAEVQPRALFAPPRIWEKMYSQIALAMDDAIRPARWAYARAIARGRARAEATLAGRPHADSWADPLFDALALRNVRTRLGLGGLRHGMTGAAPISPDLIRWFLALGVNLREAYGATETSGLCTVMPYARNKPGTVGKPPESIELKIGAEGEILVRGPNVFAGYRKRPDLTAEAIDKEGWLHTGDVGEIDADGYLRITDRIKDILITAGGKNVTPSLIENQLKFSPYISDAVAIGDRKPYLTALVMLDHDNVAQFAQSRAVPFTNYASLARAPEIVALIKAEIETANAKLARVEQIKDFRIIDTQLTAEDEELTPTMKLKRMLVNRKYAALIEGMYR